MDEIRTRTCRHCGGEITDGAVVCRHCGRILTGENAGATGDEAARLRRRRHGLFWVIAAAGIVCLIGVMSLVGYLIYEGVSELSEDPELESFVDQLMNGENPDPVISGSMEEELDSVLDEALDPDVQVFDTLDDAQLSALGEAYLACFAGNDRDAMAALFHPAALAAYDGDKNAMIDDLDEQHDLYGMKLTRHELDGAMEVEADDVATLEEALGEQVDKAMMVEYTAWTDDGQELVAALLCVRVGAQWYLYYAY